MIVMCILFDEGSLKIMKLYGFVKDPSEEKCLNKVQSMRGNFEEFKSSTSSDDEKKKINGIFLYK